VGCGCSGGSKSKQKYEVVASDGKVTVVDSRTEALALVRKNGGSWRPAKG
jgi:hypothetical protein